MQSRDWDAPTDDLPTHDYDEFESPPNISPYYGDSTQRVASEWGVVASGGGHSDHRSRTRDPRDKPQRSGERGERYVTSPERHSRYAAPPPPKRRVLPIPDK